MKRTSIQDKSAQKRRLHRRAVAGGLALGLLLATLLTVKLYKYNTICNNICDDTLRLHILANSDSAQDQALKLAVRDAILKTVTELVEGAENRQQAQRRVAGGLAAVRRQAKAELRRRGSEQTVAVRLERRWFAARDYEGFSLPAGVYAALRVELGQAQGHNWFCVLYPELCVGSAQARYQSEAENELVFGQYAVRFATVDVARELSETVRKKWQTAQKKRQNTGETEHGNRQSLSDGLWTQMEMVRQP